MNQPLAEKVAIVTGGARGIGLAIARKLSAQGASVVIWDRELGEWDGARAGFEPKLQVAVDVSSSAEVRAAFDRTLSAVPHVDILVNNAGINGPVSPCWEYPEDAWHRVIAVDLDSVFHCCRVAIPHMRSRGGGRIVNVASIAGKEGVQLAAFCKPARLHRWSRGSPDRNAASRPASRSI